MTKIPRRYSSLWLVFFLWVAGLCAAAQYAKFSVLFPYLRDIYPVSTVALGVLVSIVGILGVVLGLFTGLIVARLGYKTMLIPALLVAAILSFYQSTLPAYEWMLLSRLLEGGSHLIMVVAAPTLIAHHSSDQHRALAMTLWSTFFGVAFALLVWLGLPLVNHYGVSSLFLAHGALSLFMAVVLILVLPADTPATMVTERLTLRDLMLAHITVYRSASMSAPALGWLFYTLTFVSLLTILPGQIIPQDQAHIVGALPLLGIAVALLSGLFLMRRYSAISLVSLGFLVSALVATVLVFGANPIWFGIALFATLGLVQASSFAAVPELNRSTQSQAYANGAMAQMGNLGNTLGTPVFVSLLAVAGVKGLFVGVVICYVAGLACHAWLASCRRGIGIHQA